MLPDKLKLADLFDWLAVECGLSRVTIGALAATLMIKGIPFDKEYAKAELALALHELDVIAFGAMTTLIMLYHKRAEFTKRKTDLCVN